MRRATYTLVFAALAIFPARPLGGQQREIHTLSDSLAQEIAASGKKAIAVVDFTDLQGRPTELGRFLAEEFAVALARTHKGFDVIDRTHLKAILAEHKLTSTGLIDPTTAKKLGQIVGADALLTGTMTPFSESVRVAVKVLATDTARIVAADDIDLPKTRTIIELVGGSLSQQSVYQQEGRAAPGLRDTNTLPPRTMPPGFTSESGGVFRRDRISVTTSEIRYEITECKGIGDSVRCAFIVTNLGADRKLLQYCANGPMTINQATRAFDNFGIMAGGSDCSIGNVQGKSVVDTYLISGVPVRGSFLFRNLSPNASNLPRLLIHGYTEEHNSRGIHFEATFRNVPVTR